MSIELSSAASLSAAVIYSIIQADSDACVKNVWKFAWLKETVDIKGSTYSLYHFFPKGMYNLFLNIIN